MTAAAGRRYKTKRYAVDLSPYPELTVIYLGMRATSVRGIATILGLVRPVRRAAEVRPDGLLVHEFLIYSLLPLQVGLRQYWRDFASLEAWARTGVHSRWWQDFLRDPRGTVLLHELYSRQGGMEGLYGDRGRTPARVHGPFTGRRDGLLAFAPARPAQGPMFSARGRLGLEVHSVVRPPLTEPELDAGEGAFDGNQEREAPTRTTVLDLVEPKTAAAVARVSVRQVTSLLRTNPTAGAPTTPGWTVRDTAAHLAGAIRDYRRILQGEGSPVARLDDIARRNAEMVQANHERDCAALAHQIEKALGELPEPLGRDESDPVVRWHAGLELPLATAWAVLAAEALVHGYDIAVAAGTRWQMSKTDVTTTLLGLLPLLPHYVDAEHVGELRACLDVRLRSAGRPRVQFLFEAGELTVDKVASLPVDCHISADPAALLLLAYGRLGAAQAALSGRVVSWGRKPWLAFVLATAFRNP